MIRPPLWQYCSASVAGSSHSKQGKPCQDRNRVVSGRGWVVATLADGAGSAAEGGAGAEIAATMCAFNVAYQLDDCKGRPHRADLPSIIEGGATAALGAIRDRATRSGNPIGTYACTLLLSIQCEELIAAAQIGDGGIVLSDDGEIFESLTTPHHGEYANETTFLTSKNAMRHLHLAVRQQQPAALAMFSDGLERLVTDTSTGKPHQPFFQSIFQWLARRDAGEETREELAAMLMSPRIGSRTDDDVTLVLTQRANPPEDS